MAVNVEQFSNITDTLSKAGIALVAVSKTKPAEDIQALYDLGQRDFGENYVQELVDKQSVLPSDIRWHFIGHLQRNKVKYIAPFVHLIHGVDSFKLLNEINKQAIRCNRVINCLLQVHIAQEETKFGMDEAELTDAIAKGASLCNVKIEGLMGMASFTTEERKIREEFHALRTMRDKFTGAGNSLPVLSMGMSGDYGLAIEQGSTMVRIGSLLFGARN